MTRWFRHYAGMARDDKLVRASIKSGQTVERVLWVWSAILESAAEINDDGRYEVEKAEIARFLRCPAGKIAAIESALFELGRVNEGKVTNWASRQFKSDRSAERTKAYRDRHRDAAVTSHDRHGDAPDTETDTEVSEANASGADAPDPASIIFGAGLRLMVAGGVRESNARSLLGKWRKDQGDPALIAALGTCKREGAINPTAFIEGIFRSGGNGTHQPNHGANGGGKRSSGALALLRQAESEERAERDQAFGGGTWPSLQALGAS